MPGDADKGTAAGPFKNQPWVLLCRAMCLFVTQAIYWCITAVIVCPKHSHTLKPMGPLKRAAQQKCRQGTATDKCCCNLRQCQVSDSLWIQMTSKSEMLAINGLQATGSIEHLVSLDLVDSLDNSYICMWEINGFYQYVLWIYIREALLAGGAEGAGTVFATAPRRVSTNGIQASKALCFHALPTRPSFGTTPRFIHRSHLQPATVLSGFNSWDGQTSQA